MGALTSLLAPIRQAKGKECGILRILIFILQVSAIVITQPKLAPIHGLTSLQYFLLVKTTREVRSRQGYLQGEKPRRR